MAVEGSFRDPNGFLFTRDDDLYRQVNESYREDFELLSSIGLYEELVGGKLLVAHEQVDLNLAATDGAVAVLRPQRVPFISYPYEWSFGQLKDAALLTLEIQKRALGRGMSLKDASAYNVQFVAGKPIFIDTLSFEQYREGSPWVAYRQFCQHFLAPLALMARVDIRLGQLFRIYMDGVPLDLASRLLPWTTWWSFALGIHIHMHSKSQKRHATNAVQKEGLKAKVSKAALLGIVDSLQDAVHGLCWRTGGTEWFDYYEANNNYGKEGLTEKERLVKEFLGDCHGGVVWDLGANTGRFSRIAAAKGARVMAWDIDPGCAEANYQMVKKNGDAGVLPLLLDLTNPSPGTGWNNTERASLAARGPADTILALGLIHHLAITNNTPLPLVADLFAKLGKTLILEFVPKEDSQVQKLLATREDIFDRYTMEGFESAFAARFDIADKTAIPGTKRTIYRMTQRVRT